MSLSPLYLDPTSDLHVSTAFERPPRFPLASFGPGKARYLSGPSECALLQILVTNQPDRALLHSLTNSQVLTFIARRMVSITQTLAHSVDSLVRVSRRLVKDRVHYASIAPLTTPPLIRSIHLPRLEASPRRERRSRPGYEPLKAVRGRLIPPPKHSKLPAPLSPPKR